MHDRCQGGPFLPQSSRGTTALWLWNRSYPYRFPMPFWPTSARRMEFENVDRRRLRHVSRRVQRLVHDVQSWRGVCVPWLRHRRSLYRSRHRRFRQYRAFSAGFPPKSVESRATRWSPTSRTKTPSSKSIKLEKFVEPPQKKEIATLWFSDHGSNPVDPW